MGKRKYVDEDFAWKRSPIMTPKEAAKYLGLHLVTVYRLVKKGELPGAKLGGQWRFTKELLDKWLAERTNRKP